MESLLRSWDGEELVVRFDRPTGAWLLVGIHSTRLGPAVGGTRMKPYACLDDAVRDVLRLSRGMSMKWAAGGLDFGGGKAVLMVPPRLEQDARRGLLLRYGELLQQLGGLFMTGQDSGTSEQDMVLIAERAAPFVHGLPGGAGDPAPYTARGVLTALEVTAERLFDDGLSGRRVLIQGLGAVGRRIVAPLRQAGAVVAFSDVDPVAVEAGRALELPFVAPDEVYATPCDLFAPCAFGAILDERTIPQLRCRGVAGAANNQLATPDSAPALAERGILYAPDFIANCGGAVGVLAVEQARTSREQALERVEQAVRTNLALVFDRASGGDTDAAATALAMERLA
jgi:leucine dehydrogenase